jgi:hypothetical protein
MSCKSATKGKTYAITLSFLDHRLILAGFGDFAGRTIALQAADLREN